MPERPTSADLPRTPLAIAGENAENARRRLRAMMAPAAETSARERHRAITAEAAMGVLPSAAADYRSLRAAALAGVPALLQTALADALGIEFHRAKSLFGASGHTDLLAALRSLALTGEEAFLLTAAAFPSDFAYPESIRLFLDRFERLPLGAARDRVRAWKSETISAVVRSARSAVNDAAPASVSFRNARPK